MIRPSNIRENFLWTPLLLVAISNVLYLFLLVFVFFVSIISKNPRDIETMHDYPLLFIASTIIIMGWGIRFILISNGIGIILGFLSAPLVKRPFPEIWKRRIVFFLISFYVLIFGSLTFLMVKY